MKKLIILTLLTLILIFLFLFTLNKTITGNIISESTEKRTNFYSYTKAICNETNYCQDYEIICENNKTISINPVTEAVAQFDKDWRDARSQEQINKLCG